MDYVVVAVAVVDRAQCLADQRCRVVFRIVALRRFRLCDNAVEQFPSGAQPVERDGRSDEVSAINVRKRI